MPCRYWPIVGTFLLSMLLYVDRACMSAAKPAVAVILEETGKLDPSKKPSAADRTVTTEGGRFPADPPPVDASRIASEPDKGHVRQERRTSRTTSILKRCQLRMGLQQAFFPARERTIRGQKTIGEIYWITSLSPPRATAAKLLRFTRDHWKIENGLRYVRDGTLKEDACRVRSGSAPQVLAAVRNRVVHQLSQVDSRSCPEAIELLQMNPEQARELIGVPKCE